jgi:lipopolysaccharide export system permease protein
LFQLGRGRLALKYIFFEMLPVLMGGLILFIFILLMFQAIRLTEYVIIHGASAILIGKILIFLSVCFLPVILPMSLLFTILFVYGRLSADSEIMAFKSLGLSLFQILLPALILGSIVSVVCAHISFSLAPWGNRETELLVHRVGASKPTVSIKQGVFSEGFFDLVFYANEVDEEKGILKKVFIYDERDPLNPLTIIAQEGRIMNEASAEGNRALLRLFTGNIHRTHDDVYTKIDFESSDIYLFDRFRQTDTTKTLLSYSLQDLNEALKHPPKDKPARIKLELEYYRRWAIAAAGIIFALLGVGLGTTTNRRAGRGGGAVLCLACVVTYWLAYAGAESLAKNGLLPTYLAAWLTNLFFLAAAFWSLKRAAQ